MKTHDIANLVSSLVSDADPQSVGQLSPEKKMALSEVARLLKQSPNMEANDAKLMKKTDQIAVSLQALVSLSKYSKQQWVSVIHEFSLPINLNPRASSRDVVGKVLSFLDAHPEFLQARKRTSTKNDSSNLEDTLNKLINYRS